MKDFIKLLEIFLIVLVIIVVGTFASLGFYRYFAPKFQSAERKVFEETKSYTYGSVQELARYHYEWLKTDKVGKKAIENLVRQQFANFPPDKINDPELRRWFNNIINGRY